MKRVLIVYIVSALAACGSAKQLIVDAHTPHSSKDQNPTQNNKDSENSPTEKISNEKPKALEPRPFPLVSGVWSHSQNQAHYVQFASWTEAANWFRTYHSVLVVNGYDDPKKIVSHSHDHYKVIEALIEKQWSGFQKLFPRDTEKLNPPKVVIIDDPEPNAYVVYDGVVHHRIANVIVVHSGLVSYAKEPEALHGVISHELAHLVLKHAWPENEFKVEKFYFATQAQGPGILEQDNPTARKLGLQERKSNAQTFDAFSQFHAQYDPRGFRPEPLNLTGGLGDIRIYTSEQQADDVSVGVLQSLGLDPGFNAKFILTLLSAAEKTSCDKSLATNQEPVYGDLSNIHHEDCWRVWNMRKVIQYLEGE